MTVQPAADIGQAARLYAARDWKAAEACCRQIVHADPHHADALHLLGVLCVNRGMLADAVGYLVRAEQENPANGQVIHNLSNAYLRLKLYPQAEAACLRALAVQPHNPDVLNNLGNALFGREVFGEAIGRFRSALAVNPTHVPSLYNLGRALAASGRSQEAADVYRAALAHATPTTSASRLADIANALGRCLIDLGRPEEALLRYEFLLERQPNILSARWNRSLALLMLGRYADGWAAYESRWSVAAHGVPRPGSAVLNLGEVSGKRVLITSEQGRGDILQFVRYAPLLTRLGARVSLSVYDDLVALLRAVPGLESIVGPEDEEPDHDLLTSIGSLPAAFCTDLATIPSTVPYLIVPHDRVLHGFTRSDRPRVGLAWSGSAPSYARAGVPARALQPLLARSDIEFHCLQKEIRSEDRVWLAENGRILLHDAAIGDFADTAALIAAMDLVISVDTAVAHLAGALGLPIWLMLGFSPDWRWMLGRDDSPWYPTMRLFRQTKIGAWNDVVNRIAAHLAAHEFGRYRSATG